MTSQESNIYSFEEFMSEDKLPPVFPSSQSSNISETPLSQHLISEVCDRDTYGPFGIEYGDDNVPPHFINSTLAYSPESMPPRSPSDDISSPFHTSSAGSSTFDPLETSPVDEMSIDEMIGGDSDISDCIVAVDDVPLLDIQLENDVFLQYLGDLSYGGGDDFEKFTEHNSNANSQLSLSPVSIEMPTVSNIKVEETPLNTNNAQIEETQPETCSLVPKKKPATRGRKRKLFSNGDEKKKDQNKEAARRYREKKKQEDARLEAEEAELQAQIAEKRKELEVLTRTHAEFVQLMKSVMQVNRRKI